MAASLLAFACFSGATHADNAADELAQKVYDRPNGRDATTQGRMVLTEKGHSPRIREMVTYRLDMKRGQTANLTRFLSPEDIAGTGLLTVDKADGSSDQWLYLPALDRVRRVATSNKGGRFVGSDLNYEDLQERKVAEDKYRLLGQEAVGGIVCERLESIPVDPDNSVYAKRISWIDPKTLLPLRIDYFEGDAGQAIKRWLLIKKERVQGFWTVMESRVIDLKSGHETQLLLDTIQYDRRLPADLFSSKALADEAIESEYRP